MSDHADFEEQYRRLYAPLVGYVLRRVQDPDVAAEVVAETFLTYWRRRDQAPGGDMLRPWLYGVARKTMANERRRIRRRNALCERIAGDLVLVRAATPDVPAEGRVAVAFAGLSAGDRELLSLVAWEGLSNGELAVALGVSRAVVRVRLHRARRRFAAAWQSGSSGNDPAAPGQVMSQRALARPEAWKETR